jgi:hypothetical protein
MSPRYSERVQEEWFEIDRHWISHSGVCVVDSGREPSVLILFPSSLSAQSEEARKRKHIATLDERLETLSQKLSRELTTRWYVPHVPTQAIQRMGLPNGFTSRISSTANLAARAIQRLPI